MMTTSFCSLDLLSFKQICDNSHEVMVYGASHCSYDNIFDELNYMSRANPSFEVKKVFDYHVGYGYTTTAEGNNFEQIPLKNDDTKQICKTGITNLILENYKRSISGKSIIPLINCIDTSYNPYPFTAKSICSKDFRLNSIITNSELRRCYKLLTHSNPKISEIAKNTFKFVKVSRNSHGQYSLSQIDPPWNQNNWNQEWEPRNTVNEKSHWNTQLEEKIRKIENDYQNAVQLEKLNS